MSNVIKLNGYDVRDPKAVHFDGADGLTDAQKAQAVDNIGAAPATLENAVARMIPAPDYATVTVHDVDNGLYWDTVTGKKVASAQWSCSKHLIPFSGAAQVALVSASALRVLVCCYDADYQYISSTPAPLFATGMTLPLALPVDTRFIGLDIKDGSAAAISVRPIAPVEVIEAPYTDHLYLAGAVANANAVISTASGYGVLAVAVTPDERYYTNITLENNFICVSAAGAAIAPTYDEIDNHGRIYTIPEDAVYALLNVQYNKYHGDISVDGIYSAVFYKVTRAEKVLCIGDSITYLDGRTNTSYDGASLFLGYQKVLQAAGYEVASAGYSGYTYAKTGRSDVGSIYEQIVEGEYSVSGYDVIVLAGGTNDDLYSVAVGEVPTTYSPTYDTATMLGGLGGIIAYIRAHNESAKIVLCTQLKSESQSRPYAEAVLYADGIRGMAQYASCHLVDAFKDLNVQPETPGFEDYFYDHTHPNRAGMQRLGALILRGVENC